MLTKRFILAPGLHKVFDKLLTSFLCFVGPRDNVFLERNAGSRMRCIPRLRDDAENRLRSSCRVVRSARRAHQVSRYPRASCVILDSAAADDSIIPGGGSGVRDR